ncbi:MAG: GntG family PLP-dependent aldolase [Thermoleophilia bacterium]
MRGDRTLVDLRSDTVTKPAPGMRRAMAEAEVGDDVYREDPTVNRLQERVAELLGKEAALFVPSGTMGNQICVRNLTKPGDEVLVHEHGHILNFEAGSAAALSGVQLTPLSGVNGIFSADQVRAALRPAAEHYARVAAVALENTHNRAGGTIWPLEAQDAVVAAARENGLKVHLDGARIWNAHVATGVSLERYAQDADCVSVCFSKGLGAPVGSALAGTKEFVEECRYTRKRYGGAMRQAGILAAACLYALDHHVERLAEDHEHAAILADRLSQIENLRVPHPVETNIVLVDVGPLGLAAAEVVEALAAEGVLTGAMDRTMVRFVTHLDVSREEVTLAAEAAVRVLDELTTPARVR